MALQQINNTPPDSGLGDSLKVAFDKVIFNFNYLLNYFSGYTELTEFNQSIGDIQTSIDDINNNFSNYSLTGHTHTISNIQNLQNTLNGLVELITYNGDMIVINNTLITINNSINDILTILDTKITDAPFSGLTYGRKDGNWVVITGGTSPSGNYVPYSGATQQLWMGNNAIDSNIGFTVNNYTLPKYGGLSMSDQYLNLFAVTDSVDFGTSTFVINPEEGLYISLKNNDQSNTGRMTLQRNYFDIMFSENFETTNHFYINADGTYSDKGYSSDWTDGRFYGGVNYDGITRKLEFNSGANNYFYTNQRATMLVDAEEGAGIYNYGYDSNGEVHSGGININPDLVQLTANSGSTTNYFNIDINSTTSTKKVISNEGFYAPIVSATTYQNLPNDLPTGGNSGQILAKNSTTNYDAIWIDNFSNSIQHQVKAGVALTKGMAVYVSSANGTNMIVSKADYTTELTSSKTMGLIDSTVALNGFANVITEGLLAGLNTSTATAGDPVWLFTGGTLSYGIANKPKAPNHMVFIGIVTRVSSTNGEIFVRPQNGLEIDELHDVLISGVTNNQILQYESSTGLWKNKTLPTDIYSTGGTYSLTAQTLTVNNNVGSSFNITGVGETAASIQSKIGTGFKVSDLAATTVTPSNQQAIVSSVFVPANTFASSQEFKVEAAFTKSATTQTPSYRLYINTTNNLTGATQIALFTAGPTNTYVKIGRQPVIRGGFLRTTLTTTTLQNDNSASTSVFSPNIPYDVTQGYYFIAVVNMASTGTETVTNEFLTVRT
jgi:hypothetical protein